MGSDIGVFVGDQIVGDLPGEIGHKGNKLPNSTSADACDLGGLGIGIDGLVLKEPEPLQSLENRIVSVVHTLVMFPLTSGYFGDSGKFLGLLATDEKASGAVSPCVVRGPFPSGFARICSGTVTTGPPFDAFALLTCSWQADGG